MVRGIRISKGSIRKPLKLDRSLTPLERRGLAVSLMHLLVDVRGDLRECVLADAYRQVSDHLSKSMDGLSLVGMRKGEFQKFAHSTTYGMLADALRLPDETRGTRTIHQAKSAEFSHVLVSLSDAQQLDHILDPKKKRGVNEAEEKRIIYVALSRARDSLSISIPQLSQEEEKQLAGLNVEVIRLD
jgi:superfamily I DNA/RNA helicase